MNTSRLSAFGVLRYFSNLMLCITLGLAGISFAQAANVLNGQNLYNNNCFVCHGPGGPTGARGGRTAAQIAAAISTQPAMAQFIGKFSASDLEDIAAYLAPQSAAAPVASVSPSALTFADTVVGQSGGTQSAILSNTGSAALNISAISIGGGAAGDYSLAGGSCAAGVSLAPNASCTLVVAFKPTTAGGRFAALNINYEPNGGLSTISLNGSGSVGLNYQGLWWNPDESGWGMSVTQHGSMIFAAMFTYDQAGQPTWYVMSSCPLSGPACSGEIYKVVGGTGPGVPWNGTGKVVSSAGTGTLTFTDVDHGKLSFILGGISGSKTISRQVFANGTTLPTVDYTDLWWNQNESGWGVSLTQQFGMIFAIWYTYDANGKAIWYVASSCPVMGAGCSGDLYQVTGGSPLTSVWNGANKLVNKVGTVSFAFSDSASGTMTYSINGVTGNRAITRQGF